MHLRSLVSAPWHSKRDIVPPSGDPFYTEPVQGLSLLSPGSIIRWRPAPDALAFVRSQIPVSIDAVYQLLYRTTDSLGQPTVAVSTMIVPSNADSFKLLSYQTAYDQADPNCSPSYTFRSSVNNTSSTKLDLLLLGSALNQGWYVSSPDYEGIDAQYVAGIIAGQATLDSVRAALQSTKFTKLAPTAIYAMWGYSGGALASEWAAELQSTYAPELHFIGAALGGLTPSVASVLNTINRGPFLNLAPKGLIGLSRAYSNLSDWLNQNLVPAKALAFASGFSCTGGHDFSYEDLGIYFTRGFPSLADPVPASVFLAAGQMGLHGLPTFPLYFYKAVADEVSPIADTNALYNNFCATGRVNIQYRQNVLGDHVTESILGASGALSFLIDRFNGAASTAGCQTQYVATPYLDFQTIRYFGYQLFWALDQALLTLQSPQSQFGHA